LKQDLILTIEDVQRIKFQKHKNIFILRLIPNKFYLAEIRLANLIGKVLNVKNSEIT